MYELLLLITYSQYSTAASWVPPSCVTLEFTSKHLGVFHSLLHEAQGSSDVKDEKKK